MRILNKEEYTLFKSVLGSTQEGIRDSIHILLNEYYGEENVLYTEDYVVALGKIPIGIVAHMDTVHREPVKELFYDKEQNVLWSPEGLGADDRAGIYAMVEILRRGHRPTLILTTDEETGGLGAAALIGDHKSSPCKLNFLIELDRRGKDDCVFYDCDNAEFEDFIEDFGFKTNWGSFSDISYICPAWGMAGVNLSIGYEDEHSYSERLYVDYMFDTVDKVCNIFEKFDEEKDDYIYIQGASAFRTYGGYDVGYSDIYGSYGTYSPAPEERDEDICWGCVGTFPKSQIKEAGGGTYCEDCFNRIFTYCIDCGEVFEDRFKVHLLCEKCRTEEEEV